MAMSLAAVFGGSVTEEAAKGLAVAALKRTALKQPIKNISKELAKLIPFAGLGFFLLYYDKKNFHRCGFSHL